jgi:hypothetical protein
MQPGYQLLLEDEQVAGTGLLARVGYTPYND